MKKKRYTIAELTRQLQAQGEIILELKRDADQRSRLEIANTRSGIMREEVQTNTRGNEVGEMVRATTAHDVLEQVESVQTELDQVAGAVKRIERKLDEVFA